MRTAIWTLCLVSCAAPKRPASVGTPASLPPIAEPEPTQPAPDSAPVPPTELPAPPSAPEAPAVATPAPEEPPAVPPAPAAETPRPKRARAEPREKDSAADPAAGRAHFVRYCAKCHGEDGKGQTTMGKKLGIADMSDPSWNKGRTEAAMRAVVRKGDPKKKQPAFGPDKLDDAALRDVVAYLRTLAR